MRKKQNQNTMARRKKQTQPWLSNFRMLASNGVQSLKPSLTQFMLLAVGLLLAALAYISLIAIENVFEVPVEQVEVKGHLHYQDKEQIRELINHYVENGFMRVDLEQLHTEMRALPWIASATVKRQMPTGLQIELTENEAVAYWNETAMINRYGEVFQPDSLAYIEGLPDFRGHDHKQVIELYASLNAALPEEQKPVRGIYVNQRKTVKVMLASSLTLVMKLDEIDEQLLHWQQISRSRLNDQLYAVSRVDLRYNNGAAILWKEGLALGNQDKRGGH